MLSFFKKTKNQRKIGEVLVTTVSLGLQSAALVYAGHHFNSTHTNTDTTNEQNTPTPTPLNLAPH